MGFIELTDVSYALPGGWTLFEGVSFRVPEGEHAGLVGANGIGKSTLLRLIVGDDPPKAGTIQVDGRVGLMRQFVGSDARPTTVRDFLLAYAEVPVAEAAARVAKAERWMHDHPGEEAQMRYASALAHWGEIGGYEAEVLFDVCTHAAFGHGYPECAERKIETLSGGERKRLSLEVILRSRFDTILLDEPETRWTSRASAGSRTRSPRAPRRSCS
jgi:ATPase subunit of ABC transporter with duplicated ATPase domains